VVTLVGATGDLSRRKLLPGLFHLIDAGFIPGCRIIGVSLDVMDAEGFRAFAREALDEFSTRELTPSDWAAFSESLDYVPLAAGPEPLRAAVLKAERSFDGETRRVNYLSVPPNAALLAVRLLAEAGPVSTRRSAPIATWWSPICSRSWPSSRWSRRPRWSRGRSARRRTRSSAPCCQSTRSMWCAANMLAIATRKASIRNRRPRR
jgi:hypothetical protein